MFYKEPLKNIKLCKTESLLNRLSDQHRIKPKVAEDGKKMLAGFKGEKSLTYYLNFIPDDCFIFHDLRLQNGHTYFQMDYLVLTSSFALIIECKNFYGELHFDTSFNQMIRTVNDQSEAFVDPISQVKRQRHQLFHFFKKHNLPLLPIESLVVISNSSTIIKGDPSIKNSVIHSHHLLERWKSLVSYYKKPAIDKKMLQKTGKILFKNHCIDDIDILSKYSLELSDIISGVQCPSCLCFAMFRKQRRWICPHCGASDQISHVQALNDYFLLIKPTIKNKEFREFMHVSSIDAASKMLIRLNLPFSGINKGRVYYNPEYKGKLK
ncbi:nuclease-related domain-containing protein [Niallia nealsonii]|uniref:Nuclease n=1 Tax=Niallia nealsonii TaxID=115979 RepID=A0A2N0Z5S6_9BACI|nr:nuclease-related domain-containing protein [Niallia nealsonii]PKG24860.1 nuclease [Niallia nealsonii]